MNMGTREPAPAVGAVHDLSCVGRCSLTVVIPVLAALGVQPVPLPTAVLSTHTGGYGRAASRDLTDFLPECIAHWKSFDLKLDAVYSGYLASIAQAEAVKELCAWQKAGGAKIIVDPVMGDGGRLYSAIPTEMPAVMRALCDGADVITPNLTEAAFMQGKPYPDGALNRRELLSLLDGFGAGVTIITSVPLEDGRHANVCRIRETGESFLVAYNRIPVHYPGTGDLFTSVLTGLIAKGTAPGDAMRRASAFLERVIEDSWKTQCETRGGVQLEQALAYLLNETGNEDLPPLERL